MKRKLINSFLILSSSMAITKLFSIIHRMMLARFLSLPAMSLYFLVMPTVSLCITLGQLGIPSAVFRLIANKKYQNRKIIISAITISFFTAIIVMITLLLSSRFISDYLLKNKDAYYPLLSLILFIPLVGISGIIKNYFLAKQNIYLIAKSGFIEEITRLVFSYIMLSHFSSLNDNILVTIALFSMSIGELCSILYLLSRIKQQQLRLLPIKNNFQIKEMLQIAIPLTGSRIYQCLISFLEPIVLVYIASKAGYNQAIIQQEYAIISGYVLSLLVTPTFLNNAIYRLLLPILTDDVVNDRRYATSYHVILSMIASIIIALPFTIAFYFYPGYWLQFFYHNTSGALYLKYLAIPFIIFYLGTPLSALLQALNKNKAMFYISILQSSLELLLVIYLSKYFGALSLAIASITGIIVSIIAMAYCCFKYLFIDN